MKRFRISGLSDKELLSRVKKLVEAERHTTLEILHHLNEVERRRLHLSLGFRSMFDYCTRRLGYSASSAGRRIQTARALRRFPALVESLRRGEVNLSTVSLVASLLTEENHVELLKEIKHKSQREVEAVVARHRPRTLLRDRVKPVCIRVPAGEVNGRNPAGIHSRSGSKIPGGPPTKPDLNKAAADTPGKYQDGSGADSAALGSTAATVVDGGAAGTVLKQLMMVQFSASEEFMKKFEEARSLLSNRFPGGASFAEVFEVVLDEFLDRHSPARRKERRDQRSKPKTTGKKPEAATSSRETGRQNPAKPCDNPKCQRSRRIPAALRDQVFVRDRGRCTYKDPGGQRCGATRGLTIDHVVPFARGGPNTADNLRLLCAQHNMMEAERVYGPDLIRQYRRRE